MFEKKLKILLLSVTLLASASLLTHKLLADDEDEESIESEIVDAPKEDVSSEYVCNFFGIEAKWIFTKKVNPKTIPKDSLFICVFPKGQFCDKVILGAQEIKCGPLYIKKNAYTR